MQGNADQLINTPSNKSFDEFAGKFSPVVVSPGRSPLRGNLTGLSRKVKDTCVSWHDYVQKWKLLIVKGVEIITQISNKKVAMIDSDDSKNIPSVQYEMPEGVQELCLQLESIVTDFENIVTKMRVATENLKVVAELDKKQSSDSGVPLFQTWPTDLFHSTAHSLLEMFENEYKLKRHLSQTIAFETNRDTMVFYNVAWLQEPYIDTNADLLLESMLVETGLR